MLIGLYINLNKRKDRRLHFHKLKKYFNFIRNIGRYPATYHNNGSLGCSLSHLKCLQFLYIKTKTPYVAVFEDDFTITNTRYFLDFTRNFEKIKNNNDWDLITLTPHKNSKTIKSDGNYTKHGFKRIQDTQTMTGYIIKREFIPVLIQCLKLGVNSMKAGKTIHTFTCDQVWKRLQGNHVFICYNKQFASQLPGWSDIDKRRVNYNSKLIN